MRDGTTNEQYLDDPILKRLPEKIRRELSDEQRAAIAAAVGNRRSPQPVNIRISIPLLRWRFYFALVAGKERRSRDRLAFERRSNPLGTTGNVLFAVFGALALYLLTLGGFLLYASIVKI